LSLRIALPHEGTALPCTVEFGGVQIPLGPPFLWRFADRTLTRKGVDDAMDLVKILQGFVTGSLSLPISVTLAGQSIQIVLNASRDSENRWHLALALPSVTIPL